MEKEPLLVTANIIFFFEFSKAAKENILQRANF